MRLLLPFTHGIEASAINQAITQAYKYRATLVLLSLIGIADTKAERVRPEKVEQSRDFLEFVRHRASSLEVPVERIELFTHDITLSIYTIAQEMECDGILLFVRNGNGILLTTHEITRILEDVKHPLYIIYLPHHKNWLSSLIHRPRKPKEQLLTYEPGQDLSPDELLFPGLTSHPN
ncbi:hypothetical protein EPA93_43535 [Ktedonosporobacter rubrisoli]|uniref:Universal stress protein n=1 Tax=Ktedonosporobacter rubrisoli TaxID=2509675 RepID=A0A4P6K2N9_KTERU|nr:hypothetical protein [Ktedonosporobacter rubrisoli]QBD82487.1 hypothetical protein EPA93_43535 [Ktedonosporobacter rubrisoli]